MRQYSRIDAEMRDGVLESGVVTESREPREVVCLELARLFERRRHVDEMPDTEPEIVPLRWTPWSRYGTFAAIDLQPLVEGSDGDRAWSSFKARMASYWEQTARTQWKKTGEDFLLWRGSELDVAGVSFRLALVNERVRPIVLTPERPEVAIPINRACDKLHILGQVTLPGGFPSNSIDGEKVAAYTLEYPAGQTREIPLRNGDEVAQANLVQDAGRIDPQTTEAQRALVFVKDLAREHYQILLYSVAAEGGSLARIRCRLAGQQPLVLFAVTVEASSRR
jgi:hypothetical protein